MPEEQELKLVVTLDDEASAQLGRLQQTLQSFAGSSSQTSAVTNFAAGLRGAGQHASSLHGSLNALAGRAGFVGGFFFGVGQQVHRMADEFVKATLDVKKYADEMVRLDQNAQRAATSMAQFRSNVAVIRESGVAAGEAERMLQGYAASVANLQQQGSPLRQKLMAGLQGEFAQQMREVLRTVETGSQTEGLNAIRAYMRRIREYWEQEGKPELGAQAEASFAAELQMRGFEKFRGVLREVSREEKQMMEDRKVDAEKFQESLEKQGDSTTRIVQGLQSIAFQILPIVASSQLLAEYWERAAQFIATYDRNLRRVQQVIDNLGGWGWFEGGWAPTNEQILERLRRKAAADIILNPPPVDVAPGGGVYGSDVELDIPTIQPLPGEKPIPREWVEEALRERALQPNRNPALLPKGTLGGSGSKRSFPGQLRGGGETVGSAPTSDFSRTHAPIPKTYLMGGDEAAGENRSELQRAYEANVQEIDDLTEEFRRLNYFFQVAQMAGFKPGGILGGARPGAGTAPGTDPGTGPTSSDQSNPTDDTATTAQQQVNPSAVAPLSPQEAIEAVPPQGLAPLTTSAIQEAVQGPAGLGPTSPAMAPEQLPPGGIKPMTTENIAQAVLGERGPGAPVTNAPAVTAAAAAATTARTTTTAGRVSGPTDQAIVDAAKQYGLDPNYMRAIAALESSSDPGSNRNKRTQYKGLFQLNQEEFQKHGGGDLYSARDNANAAAKLFAANRDWFKQKYGRDPSDAELYMMHQQGRGFITKGTMTNIANNLPPGVKGPQTKESFQAAWAKRIEQLKQTAIKRSGAQTTTTPTAAPPAATPTTAAPATTTPTTAAPAAAQPTTTPVTPQGPGTQPANQQATTWTPGSPVRLADEKGRSVDADTLAMAEQLGRKGDIAGLEKMFKTRGYHMGGTNCGKVATKYAAAAGYGPPKDSAVATRWHEWGTQATPDIINRPGIKAGSLTAVSYTATYGPRKDQRLKTGELGGHVVHIVPGTYDPKTGKAFVIDQYGGKMRYIRDWDIRIANPEAAKVAPGAKAPGATVTPPPTSYRTQLQEQLKTIDSITKPGDNDIIVPGTTLRPGAGRTDPGGALDARTLDSTPGKSVDVNGNGKVVIDVKNDPRFTTTRDAPLAKKVVISTPEQMKPADPSGSADDHDPALDS